MTRISGDLEAELRSRFELDSLRITRLDPVTEGHSGFTYRVTVANGDAESRYVLRLPPPGASPTGSADVARQGRIMAALHGAGLPVPAILSVSSNAVIDGRPYLLMEEVSGDRIEVAAGCEEPARLAASAIATLKRIHKVPLSATGIGDEEVVPLTGELARWARLMDRGARELTMRATALADRLAATVPPEQVPALVHADYHMGNMLFRDGDVVTVLDWEIAELGQPLIDLGCLCVVTSRRWFGGLAFPGGTLNLDVGLFLALYGVERKDFDWYLGFSLWKYAAILGYNLMLHRKGRRHDRMYEAPAIGATITSMIDDGIELIDGRAHWL